MPIRSAMAPRPNQSSTGELPRGKNPGYTFVEGPAMDESHEKRRRFPRIHSENLVLVARSGPEPLEGLGKTEQLGLGGCKFLHPEALGIGTVLDLTLSIQGRLLNCQARVVHEAPHGDDFFEECVEFIALSQEDRETLAKIFGALGTVLADG
jgi:hypothetical protein